MIGASSVGTSPSVGGAASAPAQRNKPTQLPSTPPGTTPPAFEISISDEAKKLAFARAVTSAPVAVAAVSNNAQVDAVAISVYQGQQAKAAIDIYTSESSSQGSDSGSKSSGSLLLASAASENPQVDELATTVYLSRQALQAVDSYSEAYQSATEQQSTEIDETA